MGREAGGEPFSVGLLRAACAQGAKHHREYVEIHVVNLTESLAHIDSQAARITALEAALADAAQDRARVEADTMRCDQRCVMPPHHIGDCIMPRDLKGFKDARFPDTSRAPNST